MPMRIQVECLLSVKSNALVNKILQRKTLEVEQRKLYI